MIELVFHPNFKKNTTVSDKRITDTAARKYRFIQAVGLSYPSLNCTKLHNESFEGEPLWEFYITKKYRCLFTYNKDKKELQ